MKKQIKYILLGFILSVAFLVSPNALSASFLLLSSSVASVWGTITGTITDQTDLNTQLGLKAPLASPAFTGVSGFPNGAEGAPTMSFSAQPALGLYRAATNVFGISLHDGSIYAKSDAASFGYKGFFRGVAGGTDETGFGMIVNSDSAGDVTNTVWMKGDLMPRGTGGAGFVSAISGSYYHSSGHFLYPWFGEATNRIYMAYGGAEANPTVAAGTIKVKTGTNLTLDADNVAITGGVLAPALATSSAATTGTLCWTTGTGNVNVDTTTTCLLSAGKYKQDVEPLDVGLTQVMSLRPVSYRLKKEYDATGLGRQVGFIAEEVQKVDGRLVSREEDGSAHGVRYLQMTALLTKAIQELKQEVDAQKSEITLMKTQMAAMQAAITELQKKVKAK